MNRRTFLAALLATPALAAALAACGDDSQQSSSHSFPQAADDVVLRISNEGGFVAPGTNFVNLPTLLISGDGRAFTPGAMTLQYPGALLPAIFEQSITSDGIERLLQLADEKGLLGPAPDYALPPGDVIADASDTVVTLDVNGKTYVHRANALGIDDGNGFGSTPARDNLAEFVALVNDLAKAAGATNVGEAHPYSPDRYRLQATVVDPSQWTDPSPTIVDWPADAGLELADSAECASLPAAKGDALFADATQLTFFQEGELVYQLSVVAALPGDADC
jgi:hypothetical protein